jgi:hypothetical protein
MPMHPRPMTPTDGPPLPSVVVCIRFIFLVDATDRSGWCQASTEDAVEHHPNTARSA